MGVSTHGEGAVTDYRFSSERPGRVLRARFGAMSSWRNVTTTAPPNILAEWTEPDYSLQNEAYAARRIPTFARNLDAIETSTVGIDRDITARNSSGTIQGSGEQAVMVMPVSGACPANGPLAYVYEDLFAAAQANLASLGREKPPRYSPFELIERWARLIAWNIDLMFVASNIYPMFRFPDAQPRTWSTNTTGGTTRTLRFPNETKDGHPYPSFNGGWGMQVPQSTLDTKLGIESNLRAALRLSSDPMIANYIAPESCLMGGACPRPLNTYHQLITTSMAASAFRRYSGSDHLTSVRPGQLRRDDYRSVDYLRKSFEPTTDELRTGAVYSGSSSTGYGGAWQTLQTVFMKAAPGATFSKLYWSPVSSLIFDQSMAQDFSRVSLPVFIAEAIGWYVFNHNVWYAEKLNLTPEQLRAQQRAVASAGLDRTVSPILGVMAVVGSAVNPLVGVVVGILNAIGKELLLNFIQISPDTPKPLFLRVPDPAVCEGRPEEQAGRSLCPEGTTGAYPNCVPVAPPDVEERSGLPLVPIAAAAAVGIVLFAMRNK